MIINNNSLFNLADFLQQNNINLVFLYVMSKLDKIVGLYKNRYAMNIKDFLKFIYEKVDLTQAVLTQAQQAILEEHLKINDQDIRKYLSILSALQKGANINNTTSQTLPHFTDIKFRSKPKFIDKKLLQNFRLPQQLQLFIEQRQNCQFGKEISEKRKSNSESIDSYGKELNQFEILNDLESESEKQYKLTLQSSLYQNQSSTELLCEDYLLYLFQGNILHDNKKQKRHLIEAIEKHTQRQVQSTKFLYQFNSKSPPNESTWSIPNFALLARTQNNLLIAIVVLDEASLPNKQGLIMCLNSKRMMKGALSRSSCTNRSFTFEQFGLQIKHQQSLVHLQVILKQVNSNRMQEIEGIFESKIECLPKILNYQLFSIVFK